MLAEPPSNLYRQIVESAHEGIWIHDLAGYTMYANVQMAELLGYSVVEMNNLTLFDLLDDDGKQQALGMLDRERQTPLTEQVDCRYVRKDASLVWCLVNRSPLLDDDGRHVGSINLVKDITERKLVDERLRHTGELLAEAQRVAHLGSWSWNIAEGGLDWSDELYRILGVSRSGLAPTYERFLGQIHPDDRGRVNDIVEACVAGGPGFTYECRVVRPDGTTIWIHAQGEPANDATGVLRSMSGTVLDITAYKAAHEAAQRTSSRYRLLQQMATEANLDVGFEQVLQLAVQEILLHTKWPAGWADLVSGDPPRLGRQSGAAGGGGGRPASGTALARRVLETGRPLWAMPLRTMLLPDDDGSEPAGQPRRYEAGFAFPVLVQGEVVAVLVFLSHEAATQNDELLETCEQVGTQLTRVVERQRATDDLAAARDAAMRSLQVKSEFLATMSHEIRTPMNGVIGLTNLLLDTQLDDRQRQYAEGVHLSGEALLTVINDILDFSKLEAGKVELDYADFEVRRIIEEVGLLLAPAAYAKDLELVALCLPDVPAVLVGDAGRIRQIVLNLVSNGVKFAGGGEVVTKVAVATSNRGGVRLRFEVSDTGIGISEQSRERLFKSFSQADASTTRRYGGTGLGLAICQRLVEAMGGTIGFDSEVGVGSTFWFEIPLTLSSDRRHRAPAPPDLLGELRVLVVDDKAANRMALRSQLDSWQMRADVVADAADALLQLRAMSQRGEPYAVALLDMCMPGMDGMQLAELISADDALSGTRLIMLTSTSEVEPAALARAGVGEWLPKPVRNSDLYDALQRVMAPAWASEQVVRSRPAPSSGSAPLSLGRILVVEDNPLNQLVAHGMVTTLGYSVDIVNNGAEAVRAILQTDYAAVLMDCHMPVMDGFEATREIRRRAADGVRIPVIAMTAGAMAEDRERCTAAGMDDFVAKPVTVPALAAALARWARPSGYPSQPELSAPTPDRPLWDDEPAFDLNRLAQLRQLDSIGGTDLLHRLVGLFTRDGKTRLGSIREAAAAHSVAELHSALHELKGASANMGANRVAALCHQLEEQTLHATTGTTLVTARQLQQLQTELDRANQALAQALGDG